MDAGRFLFNFEKDKSTFVSDLETKLDEFFKWYSNFQNIDSITKIEICTSDVSCENKCSIPINNRFSVIDIAISSKKLKEILDEHARKYGLEIHMIS
ncbi:hypothetical protein M900_2455 [Bacteriovorax sp. Seq25_V]|nr:hypothetical protein M900_2455 [Bacteriovorax sp. Seq25_V]